MHVKQPLQVSRLSHRHSFPALAQGAIAYILAQSPEDCKVFSLSGTYSIPRQGTNRRRPARRMPLRHNRSPA
jgi:hypothetical protein